MNMNQQERVNTVDAISHLPWTLVAGCVFGALTLMYLMFFPVFTLITGKRLDCGDAWLMSLVFGLGVGLSSAFLGGYAAAHGDIKVPVIGNSPVTVGLAGGICFLAVGSGISYLLASSSCANPLQYLVRPRFAEWDYSDKKKIIQFRLERERHVPKLFVPEIESQDYKVYVAARPKSSEAAWSGKYDVVLGPFDYSTDTTVEVPLTDNLVSSFGRCAEMIVFGAKERQPSTPLKMDARDIRLFQWAGACRAGEAR